MLMSAGMIAFWGVVLWLIVGFVCGDSNRRPDAESLLDAPGDTPRVTTNAQAG